MKESFKEKVYKIVKRIPKGKVISYAEVAWRAGSSGAARVVGNIMAQNKDPKIPCHRVICSDGRVGGYWGSRRNNKEKIKLLKKEGIIIRNGKIIPSSPIKRSPKSY